MYIYTKKKTQTTRNDKPRSRGCVCESSTTRIQKKWMRAARKYFDKRMYQRIIKILSKIFWVKASERVTTFICKVIGGVMRSRVRRFFCVLEKWWEFAEDGFCVSSCFHVLNGMSFLFAFFLWRLLVSYLHPVAYCLCRVWVQYHISVILIVVLLVWFYAGVCGLRVTTCYWILSTRNLSLSNLSPWCTCKFQRSLPTSVSLSW
jgi:hypothetical protein